MEITSRKNQNIQLLRSLMRERTARSEHGIFIAEGIKLLSEALSCGLKPISVLATEKAYNKNAEIFNNCLKDIEIITISEDLCGYISDTVSPQGIFFTLPLLDKFINLTKIINIEENSEKENFKKNCHIIMLDSLQDLGNAGTIIRTADAFGMNGLVLSTDSCDIHSPKLVRSAAGSVFRLPVLRTELLSAISELKSKGFTIYAAMLDKNTKKLNEVSFKEKSCIIIGNEGNGISVEVSALADEKVFIPIDNAESLNAAVAASIIMYEMKCK